MSKVFKYKVTSDFIVNTLCTITIGSGIVEYSVNTFFNDYYVKYFKEEYKNGKQNALSKSLQKQYEDVIIDLKLTEFQKVFSVPFIAKGLNPVNVGCLNTRSGCHIGIPETYDLISIDDTTNLNVTNSKLQEYLQFLSINPDCGEKFLESLILSESAKKYGIARELILTDNFRIFIKSISYSVTLLPMYALGSTLLNILPAKPVKIRALAFFILCNIGVFFYISIRNIIENYYQYETDKRVCNISEEYIHGGLEYYEKLIQRNLALRNIIPDGEYIYSEHGNEIGFISILSELPLTYRKNYLEHRLKKCKNET